MKYRLLISVIALITSSACQTESSNVVLSKSTTSVSTRHLEVSKVVTQDILLPNIRAGAVNERGVLTVPVNRSKPMGEMIDVEFFRFKRLPEANPDTPPIFLLRGGPGYPGLGDAIKNEKLYERAIYPYTKITDLVIVGQRGFGTSGDLTCDSVPPSSLNEVSNSEESRNRYRQTAEQCRDKYLAQGRDLSGYNVKEMAADVADIARGLNYDGIQLDGTSFGSFWAMAVIRQHPDLVARATLSALEGPDHTFDRPGAVKAALEAMASSAASSDRYKDRIPEEGLLEAYEAVIQRAENSPIPTTFIEEDTGETISFDIDADALRRFAYGVRRKPVFRHVMKDWPDDLLKIIEGDFSDVATRLYGYMLGTDADNAAEEIIECSSGISSNRRRAINSDPAKSLINPAVLFDTSICAVWDDAIVAMDRSDFSSDIPVVLIQGTWDISTPFEDAKSVRMLFINNHFVTIEGGSHGARFEAEDHDSSFISAIDHWYATGDASKIDQSISLPELRWDDET
ncbi:MAG: alpha/beta hydrolase [Pseudomonadota bacterium]